MTETLRGLVRRLRPFHFGTVARGAPRPLGLWISVGRDLGHIGVDRPRSFLNVTLLGRFRGRIYAKELRSTARNSCPSLDVSEEVVQHLRGALTRIAFESGDSGTRAYAKRILAKFDCDGNYRLGS